MIFRCYSTRPLVMKPITQHRSWIAVNPAMPLSLGSELSTWWSGVQSWLVVEIMFIALRGREELRNAIPYSLCGFQRVDALSEKLPQSLGPHGGCYLHASMTPRSLLELKIKWVSECLQIFTPLRMFDEAEGRGKPLANAQLCLVSRLCCAMAHDHVVGRGSLSRR